MFRKMTHKAKVVDYSHTLLALYDLSVKMINLCMEFNTQHNFCFLLLLVGMLSHQSFCALKFDPGCRKINANLEFRYTGGFPALPSVETDLGQLTQSL